MNDHYVSNEELLTALNLYAKQVRRAKRLHEDRPMLPDYIGECFLKIAERLSRKPNFYAYTFREEMISDAVENCLLYLDNFDPKKSSNPFAYFTQIIYYAFIRRIMREKRHLYVKYKIAEDMLLQHDHALFDVDGTTLTAPMKAADLYENISEYIAVFENKLSTTVKKKKPKRGLERFMGDTV